MFGLATNDPFAHLFGNEHPGCARYQVKPNIRPDRRSPQDQIAPSRIVNEHDQPNLEEMFRFQRRFALKQQRRTRKLSSVRKKVKREEADIPHLQFSFLTPLLLTSSRSVILPCGVKCGSLHYAPTLRRACRRRSIRRRLVRQRPF